MPTKVYLQTFGCAFNQADTQSMEHALTDANYTITHDPNTADICIVNSCTVKNKTDQAFRKTVRNIQKPLIIAGCIPAADQNRADITHLSQIGPDHIDKIVEVVQHTLQGKVVKYTTQKKEERISLTPTHKPIAIIPINKGCLSNCSYCATKLARGDLYSFGKRRIVQKIEQALQQGTKQVWLTSQDCSTYGLDIKETIATLCQDIIDLPYDFHLRIGMANPLFFKQFEQELIRIYQSPKVYKFLHLPLQSGSNNVLGVMKRGYKVEEWCRIVKLFRQHIPHITIATDIIVGHPGESPQDFKQTLDILNTYQPQVINYSKYSARPLTKAAQFEQIAPHIITQRIIELKEMVHDYLHTQKQQWLHTTHKVIVEQVKKQGSIVARNSYYHPIVIHQSLPIGSTHTVQIKKVTQFDYIGEVI